MNTILMLIDQLNVGGTETHVLSLTKQLFQEGVKVVIGTSGGPHLDTFESSGLEVAYLPFQSDDPVGGGIPSFTQKNQRTSKGKGGGFTPCRFNSAQLGRRTLQKIMIQIQGNQSLDPFSRALPCPKTTCVLCKTETGSSSQPKSINCSLGIGGAFPKK